MKYFIVDNPWNKSHYKNLINQVIDKIIPYAAIIEVVIVYSSNGEITVNKKTGDVVLITPNGSDDAAFRRIKKFDLDEYKRYYNLECIPDNIDILDLGYWYDNNEYEEPAMDWREEVKVMRKQA
ncbi:MAG: hypothetical protein ABJH04_08030 [Cyclobacteriaceae bacterium]